MRDTDRINRTNSEGYPDPTAYAAFSAIEQEERRKRQKRGRRRWKNRVKY